LTTTIEALEKFAQSLELAVPQPAQLHQSLIPEPDTAPVQPPLEPVPSRSTEAAVTGPLVQGWGGLPDPLGARRDAGGCGHSLRPAPDRFPPLDTLPSAVQATPSKAEGDEKSQRTAMQSEGVTRTGPRGDWRRRMGRAVLALTIGLGLTLVVRVGAWAGATYCRERMGKTLARPSHAGTHRRAFSTRSARIRKRGAKPKGSAVGVRRSSTGRSTDCPVGRSAG
jgi:hypothetical protein